MGGPLVLDHPITDRRAWRADTADEPASWYVPLPEAALAVVEPILDDLERRPRPLTDVSLSDDEREALAAGFAPVLAALESGRGFAIIEGVPAGRSSAPDPRALYWLVGQALGRPFEQDVQGTLLYDVRDMGQSVSQGARFSVTNAESTFHTDNSFGDDVLDYVGLLCLRTATAGGLSQVVSAAAAHNELLERHPDALEALYRPFHVDRRGGLRPGDSPTAPRPIIAWDGRELLVRYLRYWIEVGHQKVGEPLTPVQVEALDVLDRVLDRRDLRVEFDLRPGQMFFLNNRWILHNRTAFEDDPEPERRRHYVRLWLTSRARSRPGLVVAS